VGGAIDPDDEAYDLMVPVSGGMSTGGCGRLAVRVCAAMSARAPMEGRGKNGRYSKCGSEPDRSA
jgi:hypothetical protein